MDGIRGIIAEAVCRDEVEDGRVNAMGCIGFFYPNFAVFVVLHHKSS
jgi:hypothetical protein